MGGRTAIGVEAAAVTFFDKHAKDLKLYQSALLAGLPQAPSEYNPFRNPQAALDAPQRGAPADGGQRVHHRKPRRTQGRAARARAQARHAATSSAASPTSSTTCRSKLIERYGVGVVRRGGLRIHTTIDPTLQDQAPRGDQPATTPTRPARARRSSSIDPANGKIRAMASSGTYSDSNFNLAAQGHRQPGSAFKTFVLTTAIRKGVDPDTTYYTSKPLNIDDPDYGHWEVKTFGNTLHRHGQPHPRHAVVRQHRLRAADPRPRARRRSARRPSCSASRRKLDCYPAEGLGGLTLGVTPLEMADAYATLASGGIRHRPTGIEQVVFPDGKSEDLGQPARASAC